MRYHVAPALVGLLACGILVLLSVIRKLGTRPAAPVTAKAKLPQEATAQIIAANDSAGLDVASVIHHSEAATIEVIFKAEARCPRPFLGTCRLSLTFGVAPIKGTSAPA